MTVSIGLRTTFGKGMRENRFADLPKEFPYRADLVTRRDEQWLHTPVEVIGGNTGRCRIRALQPTVIPGLPNPLPANVTTVVPGHALQPLTEIPTT
jgi:hypothetical protein